MKAKLVKMEPVETDKGDTINASNKAGEVTSWMDLYVTHPFKSHAETLAEIGYTLE